MDGITVVDFSMLHFIVYHFRNGFFDEVMPFFSALGNRGVIWIGFAVLFLAIPRYRKYAPFLLVSICLSFVVGEVVIKPWVCRIRPCNIEIIPMLIARPNSFSFPSGHSMTSYSAAVFLWNTNRKLGRAAFVIATCIAFSRLYLFVHYPTDVLVGGLLGGVIGYLTFRLAKMLYKRK